MNAADYQPLAELMLTKTNQHQYVRAVLELTYRCNFKCPHCFVHTAHSNHGSRDQELTTDEWRDVIDQLADDGCLVITFTGGEIFCRNDFREIATHARKRRFVIRIFTNASYIDDKRADLLAEIQPIQVEVTLYGATPETYRAVAGHEIYLEKSCAGVDRLLDRGIRVVLKAPLMQQNVADMDRFAELTQARWGKRIRISLQMLPRDDRDTTPVGHGLNAEQLSRYFESHNGPAPTINRVNLDAPPCNVAKDYLVVSPFGDIFPCVSVKRSVGNVRERPIREIWHDSPFLDHLRNLTLRDYEPYYTKEQFAQTVICPGTVFRDTGNPVGASSWHQLTHSLRNSASHLSDGCGGC